MLLWEAAAAHHPKEWPDGNVSVLQVNFWKPEQAAVSMPQVRGKKMHLLAKTRQQSTSVMPQVCVELGDT